MPLKFLTMIFITILAMPVKLFAGEIREVETVGVLLNQERLVHGKHALKPLAPLMEAAQLHADDMGRNNYFSHTGQNGSSHAGRISRQGYRACYTAENIAKGQKTPSSVMKAWMNSEGHRNNMLSGQGDFYGIGIAGNIWVMVFARGC